MTYVKWRKTDLHIHSNASHDCNSAPQDIVDKIILEKINLFPKTDHNNVDMPISVAALENQNLTCCPKCDETLPELQDYATWCDKCNWNLQPELSEAPNTFYDKIYQRVGQRSHAKLLQSMIQNSSSVPKFYVSRALTFCMALFVHLISLFILAVGCFLFVGYTINIFTVLIGIACLVLAWATRPRINKLDARPLSREDFPILYKMVDDIAAALRINKVHSIVIDGEYNAFYSEVGILRRKVIGVGLPLLSVLNKQETVALISHEMAHGINGDQRRGFVVGSAINSLIMWHRITRPDKIFESQENSFIVTVAMFFANIFLWLTSHVVYLLLFIICHLNWRDSQRAEYLADCLAAEVAGQNDKISMLQKMYLSGVFERTVLKVINNKNAGSLFKAFENHVSAIPDREIERIDRVSRLTESRLDTTHPPTANRIDFIRSLDIQQPLYHMSDQQFEQLRSEILPLGSKLEQKIIDNCLVNILGC